MEADPPREGVVWRNCYARGTSWRESFIKEDTPRAPTKASTWRSARLLYHYISKNERQVAFIGGRSGIRENSICSGALNGGWARKRLFMDRITPEGVFITAVPITKLTPKGS